MRLYLKYRLSVVEQKNSICGGRFLVESRYQNKPKNFFKCIYIFALWCVAMFQLQFPLFTYTHTSINMHTCMCNHRLIYLHIPIHTFIHIYIRMKYVRMYIHTNISCVFGLHKFLLQEQMNVGIATAIVVL